MLRDFGILKHICTIYVVAREYSTSATGFPGEDEEETGAEAGEDADASMVPGAEAKGQKQREMMARERAGRGGRKWQSLGVEPRPGAGASGFHPSARQLSL